MNPGLTRRQFLRRTALAGSALTLFPRRAIFAQSTGAAEKLNVAFVGAGGRGADNLREIAACGANIVALCDVDAANLGAAAQTFPGAKSYCDFRKMLEQKDIDAVVVSTPDHLHAFVAFAAMRAGKHVYCEKPLTHSVWEARLLRETAARTRVATQMGNSAHSAEGTRTTVEWIQSGVIGSVTEVHVWTDRPKGWWPQGMTRPADKPAIPANLNWDLWIGPAPMRPYHPSYHPLKWRGWADFGTGALGDMGTHVLDAAFWALNLGHPTSVEAETSGCNAETYPEWSIVRYEFPARSSQPPLKLTWYDGGKLPPRPPELEPARQLGSRDGGTIFIGTKGTMIVPLGGTPRLIPEAKMRDFKKPDPFIPRSVGHHLEWVQACKGGTPAGANFDYAGPLTEVVLLGNVAIRTGRKIQWDPINMTATNEPAASTYIRREYREGWTVVG